MKILVTGGAGFIGSNFIKYMLKKYPNYKIVNLDLLTYAGNLDNLKDVKDNPNYIFIKGNIADQDFINNLFKQERFDYVVNFAAETHVDRSIMSSKDFVLTNVLGTQTLLDASKNTDVKKYIQISTDEVYGSIGNLGYFTENSPLSPNNPYSATKAGADMLVHSYYKTHGVATNIVRPSNNFGPYQYPEKFIPLLIINALRDKDIPIYGDGLQIRDWLYVEDNCRAIDLVLHQGISGEVYNIGANNEKTNIEIAKYILQEIGKSEILIKFTKDRPGHDRRYALDTTKIRRDLGWVPRYSFDEGIKKTIKWYLNNSNWWKKIIKGDYQDYYKRQYTARLRQ